MEKLSQTELLQEGFLDAIRAAGRGVAKVASGLEKLDKEGFSALKGPLTSFINSDPKQFVLQELKTSYYKTFNPKTINVGQAVRDSNSNRTIVDFQAERFVPTGGVTPLQTYYAYVFKGGKGNTLFMDVRDDRGNNISGEVRGRQRPGSSDRPTFTSVVLSYQTRSIPITVALLSTIITKTLGISEREFANKLSRGATDMDEVISNITNKPNPQDVLDQADIDSVYQVLETRGLTEKVKVSQKVLLEQLKNL